MTTFRVLLVLLGLLGCGDNVHLELDAAPSPASPCCNLLPDQDAARACVAQDVPLHTCGVLVCYQDDGGLVLLNFCGTGRTP